MTTRSQNIVKELFNELQSQGQIIEQGWKTYEGLTNLKSAPEIQREECRKAYFFGALHTYSALLNMVQPGMDKLDAELTRFLECVRK